MARKLKVNMPTVPPATPTGRRAGLRSADKKTPTAKAIYAAAEGMLISVTIPLLTDYFSDLEHDESDEDELDAAGKRKEAPSPQKPRPRKKVKSSNNGGES